MTKSCKEPKILFWDIETLPLGYDGFQLGKQSIRHGQLQANRDCYDIICIQYKWAHEKKVVNLHWIGKESSSESIIQEFDKQAAKADILIGKNSDRFDVKHINTQRLIHGLPPLPQWASRNTKDDLEKQMRKWFYLPSYSLDYFSKMLGVGGKNKMEFSDWVSIRNYKELCQIMNSFKDELGANGRRTLDIICHQYYDMSRSQVAKLGKAALKKMYTYGDKDTLDTQFIWEKVLPYIEPIQNRGTFLGNQDGDYLRCKWCGSKDIHKNGIDNRGPNPEQKFYCTSCAKGSKYCGKATIHKKGGYGKIK